MDTGFKEMGLPENIIKGLEAQGISSPTDIQREAFAPVHEGKDVIIRSETGSGKTLAYLLPIIMRLDYTLRKTQAIVLAPTHELASQIYRQAELLAENAGLAEFRAALIIGGANISRQADKLKEKPQLVVGSTGRILELIKLKKISAHTTRVIVADEADRLLDDANIDGLKAVIKTTLADRQLVFLSASMGGEAAKRSRQLMKEPVEVSGGGMEMPEEIEHLYIVCERREKVIQLRKIIHSEGADRAIVFINNTENIEVVTDKLNYHSVAAAGVYGAKLKAERREAIAAFREGRAQALVTSDLNARGMDFGGVTHVINMDMPEEPSFYLHRAGRTGRAGRKGVCISLVTEGERKLIPRYEKKYGIKFMRAQMKGGRIVEYEAQSEGK